MDKLDDLLKEHFRFDPLYSVAVLKVSHDLRPAPLDGFDDLLEDTLTDFKLDRASLDHFVETHKEELIATCRQLGI